jgi:glycosyltransferase involved in cell wall biosynthesis
MAAEGMKTSVCVATFNGSEFISEQLHSILVQLEDDDEVVISDDGSVDGTVEIICGCRDPRIRVVDGPGKGIIPNILNAISHASGDIIFLADQDDIWLPGRVEFALKAHEKYKVVAVDLEIFGGHARSGSYFSNVVPPVRGSLSSLVRSSHPGCAISFSASLRATILDMPNYIPMHDWGIVVIGVIEKSFFFIQKPLVRYRRHTNTLSSSGEFSKRFIFLKIWDRVKILRFFLAEVFKQKSDSRGSA